MVLHKAIVQIVIIGFLAFLGPGLFNALGGLGKAGSNDAQVGASSNATLYAFFAVFGYFGGSIFNLLGPWGNRILMCFGGACYGVYTLFVYIASNVEGAGWVAVLGGALLGIGAGCFWVSQSTQMLSYSDANTRGKFISIFWIIFNLGGMAGGLLSALLNWNSDDEGQANPASYFVFTGLMFVGAIAALFLLVNPNNVIREDGSHVTLTPPGSAMEEIKGALRVATNKWMLLLTFVFLASNWSYTYTLNFINGSLFNIRTRGINSALFWGAQMASSWFLGLLLDASRLSRRQRALYGYMVATVMFGAAWALGIAVQYGFEDHYDKDNEIPDPINISESSRCALPIVTLVLYGLADACLQSYAYWIMGAIAGDNVSLTANFAGYYKGIQSAGAAVAWGLDLNEDILYQHQLWIGFSIWLLGSILAFFVARSVESEDMVSPDVAAKLESKTSISASSVQQV